MKNLCCVVYMLLVLLFSGCKPVVNERPPPSIPLPQTENREIWFDKASDSYGVRSPRRPWTVESQNPDHKGNPDTAWERYALPLGNGFQAAMVYGNVSAERMQLNVHSLWTGGPGSKGFDVDAYDNKESYKQLPKIRQLLLDGKASEAQKLSNLVLRGLGPEEKIQQQINFGRYQTMGELIVETGHPSKVENYRRSLSISDSISKVSYQYNGCGFVRESFCSYPDRCLVSRYTSDKAGQENLKIYLESPHALKATKMKAGIVYSGALSNNGLRLACQVAVELKGGKLSVGEDGITVTGADEVVIKLFSNTDYEHNYPKYRSGIAPSKTCDAQLGALKKYNYQELKSRHLEDYHKLFKRVAVNWGDSEVSVKSLPMDERVARNRKSADIDLEEIYFQYGRYLLISSSRPGSLPANLQGIWCNERLPAWRGDYHLNINLQMNYWPSGPCNLLECQQPLIDFTDSLIAPGKKTAKAYYNARGFSANLTSNIWGFTSPDPGRGRPRFWAFFPLGGAWLTTHAWEQYMFNNDKVYLKEKAWPQLSEAADFVSDMLFMLPNGHYSSVPSWSPEHGPISKGTFCDIAMARQTLMNGLSAAKVLGLDNMRIADWQNKLDHLQPFKIGKYGQLQEWFEDIDNPKDKHRHINHLFGTYPGHQISLLKTPKLAQATRQVMINRGYGFYGWSIGWQIGLAARFGDDVRCYEVLRNLLTRPTKPNLFNVTQAFQIDGNFGGTAGIAEMLLQSSYSDEQNTDVNLLPALPSSWATGEIQGFKARGNMTVDIKWAKGKLVAATVYLPKGRKIPNVYVAGKEIGEPKKDSRISFRYL